MPITSPSGVLFVMAKNMELTMAHQKTYSKDIITLQNKPIISIKEARKILGREAIDLSDVSILGIINSLQKIASGLLDSAKVPNNLMV